MLVSLLLIASVRADVFTQFATIDEFYPPLPGPGDFIRATNQYLPPTVWKIPVSYQGDRLILSVIWQQVNMYQPLTPVFMLNGETWNAPNDPGFTTQLVGVAFAQLYVQNNLTIPNKSFTRYPQIVAQNTSYGNLSDAVSIAYYNSSSVYTVLAVVSSCGTKMWYGTNNLTIIASSSGGAWSYWKIPTNWAPYYYQYVQMLTPTVPYSPNPCIKAQVIEL